MMTTGMDRLREARDRAMWAGVAHAWCDYGPRAVDMRAPQAEARRGAGEGAHMRAGASRPPRRMATIVLSLLGLAALAGVAALQAPGGL